MKLCIGCLFRNWLYNLYRVTFCTHEPLPYIQCYESMIDIADHTAGTASRQGNRHNPLGCILSTQVSMECLVSRLVARYS